MTRPLQYMARPIANECDVVRLLPFSLIISHVNFIMILLKLYYVYEEEKNELLLQFLLFSYHLGKINYCNILMENR